MLALGEFSALQEYFERKYVQVARTRQREKRRATQVMIFFSLNSVEDHVHQLLKASHASVKALLEIF